MQVLLIVLVLAGVATMLLRVVLSRTSSARQTRRASSAEVLIQACMAEVSGLWANKTPEAFRRDMAGDATSPYMYCKELNGNGSCKTPSRNYTCQYAAAEGGLTYTVTATFVKNAANVWQLQYEIDQNSSKVL